MNPSLKLTTSAGLVVALRLVVAALEEDKVFLNDGLQETVKTFRPKFNKPNTSDETLNSLNWEIIEFQMLLEQASVFKEQISGFNASLEPTKETLAPPYQRMWVKLSPNYMKFLRNLFKKKQIYATHILVFMVADEQHNCKPFAIPVLYVPYKGIRDQEVRDLTKKIKMEMTKAHLAVVGMSFSGCGKILWVRNKGLFLK